MSSERAGCVYCGWPRARVRSRLGFPYVLPTCLPHVELHVAERLDFGRLDPVAFPLDELLLTIATSSARPAPGGARPPEAGA